jgi:hypothetical protein
LVGHLQSGTAVWGEPVEPVASDPVGVVHAGAAVPWPVPEPAAVVDPVCGGCAGGSCIWSAGWAGNPADGGWSWAEAVGTPAPNVATPTASVTSTPTFAHPLARRALTRDAGRLGFGRSIFAPLGTLLPRQPPDRRYPNQEQNRERRRDHAVHRHAGQRLLRLHSDATP